MSHSFLHHPSSPLSDIAVSQFRFHFPSGYVLKLTLPTQINIAQVTELIINYEILHEKHGFKGQQGGNSRKWKPIFLKTQNSQPLIDYVLSSAKHINFKSILNRDFQIVYAASNEIKGNQLKHYKMLKIIDYTKDHSKIVIVRNLYNGKQYTLYSFWKHTLSYHTLSQLICCKQYLVKENKSTFRHSVELFQTFQSQNHLHFVIQFLPFHLSSLKIFTEEAVSQYLDQIAKILHIIQRDGFLLDSITLSHFSINCEDKIYFNHLPVFQTFNAKNIQNSRTKYAQKLYQIYEALISNIHCPTYHFPFLTHLTETIKKGKIHKYIDYLAFRFSNTPSKIIMDSQNHHKNNFVLSLKALSDQKKEPEENKISQLFQSSQLLIIPPIQYFNYTKPSQEHQHQNFDSKTTIKREKQKVHKNKRAKSLKNERKNNREVSSFVI